MKFLNFINNNNKENNSKINGIIKMLKNLKTAKIISIIAIGFAFVLFIAVFIYVVLKIFASLATLNSVERAGAERLEGETDYEKKIIERDKFLNFTQYFDTKDEKLKEKIGFLYLLIIAGMDMILMHYMMPTSFTRQMNKKNRIFGKKYQVFLENF